MQMQQADLPEVFIAATKRQRMSAAGVILNPDEHRRSPF